MDKKKYITWQMLEDRYNINSDVDVTFMDYRRVKWCYVKEVISIKWLHA